MHIGQQHRENVINTVTAVRLKTTMKHSVANFFVKKCYKPEIASPPCNVSGF